LALLIYMYKNNRTYIVYDIIMLPVPLLLSFLVLTIQR